MNATKTRSEQHDEIKARARALGRASYQVLDVHLVQHPKAAAERFGAFLAADRGYSSRVVRVTARAFDCVASDNRAIRFYAY